MTPGDLLTLWRHEVADDAAPYLWSDDEFFTYLNDAEKQFARFTDGLPDTTTTAVTEIALDTLTDTYAVSPLILKYRSAWNKATGRPIEIVNLEDMAPRGMYFDSIPGHVKSIVTGLDDNFIRVWPFPVEALTIKLSVFRLPLLDITDASPALEIAPQHHLNLLMWVKYRAYSKQDSETFDKQKAEDSEALFQAYCGRVKAEQARARHKPRSVAYGGL